MSLPTAPQALLNQRRTRVSRSLWSIGFGLLTATLSRDVINHIPLLDQAALDAPNVVGMVRIAGPTRCAI
jgi:hypothetical protein